MKFTLHEDLEQELIQKAEADNKLKLEIVDLFKDTEFKQRNTLNGISFEAQHDDLHGMFFLDDQLSFSGYVSAKNFNTSVKGLKKDSYTAAETILDTYNDYLLADDVSDNNAEIEIEVD